MRWFRGRDKTSPTAQQAEPDAAFMQLLSQHGLAAYERQLTFGDRVGDPAWSLDQDRGLLILGGSLELPAQFLGSESEQSGTWLWAWANDSIDPRLRVKSDAARALGETQHVDVLREPQFALDRVGSAHLLSMATAGALAADAYYRCPYAGGAAYVLIDLPSDLRPSVALNERIVTFLPRAIMDLPMLNSRLAIEGYLSDINAVANATASHTIQIADGPQIAFDEQDRLASLESGRSLP